MIVTWTAVRVQYYNTSINTKLRMERNENIHVYANERSIKRVIFYFDLAYFWFINLQLVDNWFELFVCFINDLFVC